MTTTLTNAYWDTVREHTSLDSAIFGGGPMVDPWPLGGPRPPFTRDELVRRYSWTITDPATVDFVAQHCGPRVLDPMAGTGWWASLLAGRGIDVLATDLVPPSPNDTPLDAARADDNPANPWHNGMQQWFAVSAAHAVDAAIEHGAGRTLLLSWPPYDDGDAARAVLRYRLRGTRIVYIGESAGGCCGDDALFDEFERGWIEVATHKPVQWRGIRDWVTVYDRKDLER